MPTFLRVIDTTQPVYLYIGEVGLSGEIRMVQLIERRLQEASRLGFERAVVPARWKDAGQPGPNGLEIVGVRTLREAVMTIPGMFGGDRDVEAEAVEV